MPRLLFAISAHGLGHLGQAAPVCNALLGACAGLDLTIWSALPVSALRQRIDGRFTHIETPCDIGFAMHDALHVDIPASWQQYLQREHDWAACLGDACAIVHAANPDLIVSDVGDMPLAAGQALGIPTIAMSSLNWADLARHYFSGFAGSGVVLDRLDAIYARTTLALRLTPGMPMHGLHEKVLPPVGAVSGLDHVTLGRALTPHLPQPGKRRILIGMGGIETRLPFTDWPVQSDLNLLMVNQPTLPAGGDPERGIVNADTLRQEHGLRFTDLVAACDVVVCKPGYGTFVEAALAQRPVLYVCRQDWPEQSLLIDWLQQYAHGFELSPNDLAAGRFKSAVDALLQRPAHEPLPRNGATLAAHEILALLDRSDPETQGR